MRCSERTKSSAKPKFRVWKLLLGGLIVLLGLPIAASLWLLGTESGLRAALELSRRTTGFEVVADGLSGRLIGPLAFDSLRVEGPAFRLALHSFSFDWSPRALIQRRVEVEHLEIAEVFFAAAPSEETAPPSAGPPEIVLPVEVDVGRLDIGRFVLAGWDEGAPEQLEIRDLHARLSAEPGIQRIDALSATTPWGQASLSALIAPEAATPLSAQGRFSTVQEGHEIDLDLQLAGTLERLDAQLAARGAGLSGEAVAELAPFAQLPLLKLQASLGEIDPAAFVPEAPTAALQLEADLQGSGVETRLTGDVRIHNARPLRVDQGGLPVQDITLSLNASPERIELPAFDIVLLGQGRLAGNGHFVPPADEEIPASFAASGRLSAVDPLALHGSAPHGDITLEFAANGDSSGRSVLEWSFDEGHVQNLALTGGGGLTVAGTSVSDVAVDMGLGPSRIRANGAWGVAGETLQLDIDARQLEQLGYGLGGQASVQAEVSGTLQALAGHFSAQARALSVPGGVQIRVFDASGEVESGLEGPFSLQARVQDVVGGEEPQSWVEELELSLSGSLARHVLALEASLPQEDTAMLRLEGSWAEEGWSGSLSAFEMAGRFPVQLEMPADMSASAARARIAPARFTAGNSGRIEIDEAVWTPSRISSSGRLSGLAVVAQSPRRRGRGPEPLTLGAEWDIELAQRVNGQIRLFHETGDLVIPGELPTRIKLETLQAAILATDNNIQASLEVRGDDIGFIDGRAGLRVEKHGQEGWRLAPDAELDGLIHVDMPSISWLSRLMQQQTVLDGSLKAEIALSGPPLQPVVTGHIAGSDLALSLVEHGVQVSGGELLAEFDRDRVQISRLEFISPSSVRPPDGRIPYARLTATPGRLSASGGIELESGEGSFSFELDRFPVLQRTDRWLLVSGEGEAETTWSSLDLDAEFRVDAGYLEFAETPPPALSDDVVILGTAEEESAEGGMAINATVRVLLGDALYASALGLDTRLAGDLELRVRDGAPLAAIGTIATAGGVFRGYGQNLTIDRGMINFQGALDNPGLNIVALRKGLAVEAGVQVMGSARRPHIRLVSDPDVPDQEKLSWIVLGRAPSAASGADMGLLVPAAQALLGSSGLGSSLGLDEFGIGQSEASQVGRTRTSRVVGTGTAITSEGSMSNQVLTLGKRLSEDFHLSLEQSLSGAESLVRLTYQLSRQVVMVARGGTDSSADIYYSISFR